MYIYCTVQVIKGYTESFISISAAISILYMVSEQTNSNESPIQNIPMSSSPISSRSKPKFYSQHPNFFCSRKITHCIQHHSTNQWEINPFYLSSMVCSIRSTSDWLWSKRLCRRHTSMPPLCFCHWWESLDSAGHAHFECYFSLNITINHATHCHSKDISWSLEKAEKPIC